MGEYQWVSMFLRDEGKQVNHFSGDSLVALALVSSVAWCACFFHSYIYVALAALVTTSDGGVFCRNGTVPMV